MKKTIYLSVCVCLVLLSLMLSGCKASTAGKAITPPSGSGENSPPSIIEKDGKIGIGTATPEEKLHVVGANNRNYVKVQTNDGNGAGLKLKSLNEEWVIGVEAKSGDYLSFASGTFFPTLVLTKGGPGKVGIGVTSPTEKLEVNGKVKAQDFCTGTTCLSSVGGGSDPIWVRDSQGMTYISNPVAVAMGYDAKATGKYSTAIGYRSVATGIGSTAMGYATKATGWGSTAMGYNAQPSGKYSLVMGFTAKATGDYSKAIGNLIDVTGANSVGIGLYSITDVVTVTKFSKPNTMAVMGGDFEVTDGSISVGKLKGTGNAYACIDANGQLFRSTKPCA